MRIAKFLIRLVLHSTSRHGCLPRSAGGEMPETCDQIDYGTCMTMNVEATAKKSILHVCRRDVLRPLRDEILRISGFAVESTGEPDEALNLFGAGTFALVLIDVSGEEGIPLAEKLCEAIKTARPGQLVAFACNWRVAILSDCPDHILRTEFDPTAFVAGVRKILEPGE